MPPLLSPQVSSTTYNKQPKPVTPSPNYFDFPAPEGNDSYTDHAKQNWSPPSSTVRSTAAASPSVVPADQDPQFDAFRRQSQGSNKTFSLGSGLGNFQMNAPPAGNKSNERPSAHKQSSSKHQKNVSEPRDMARPPHRKPDTLDPSSAELGRSPKRMLSSDSSTYGDVPRRGSPASFNGKEPGCQKVRRDGSPDRHPRTNLPLDNVSTPAGFPKHRAETLPGSGSDSENLMVTSQHVVNLLDTANEHTLLLDLRVSTQYAQSHLNGSLNLCIPTTLLKRPSFNVAKLADTFKEDDQRRRFENWKKSRYIIVYDTSSAQMKDAQMCINTIKKFQGEGYDGQLYIIKGGFQEFAKRFPSYVENGGDLNMSDASSPGGPSNGSEGSSRAPPVIGGCPMPGLTDKPANPFFGNIRQNMDLIGGVGQMQLQRPAKASQKVEEHYPIWLRQAAEEKDLGKKVSTRFEHIERREKKRMEDALSGQVSFGTPKPQTANEAKSAKEGTVQIAGIEKGTKNRYNNIWPFEHSRVKLQGLPSSDCDYFNASHIRAAWSNKRYISTQAPIPATFNDFWNVVWQQDVRVIVMLTAEKEGPQVKAHNYWSENEFGPLKLEYLSEKRASIEPARIQRHKRRPSAARRPSTNPKVPFAPLAQDEKPSEEQPYVIVRKFTLSHSNHPWERMREITQLQYSSWPDFGAPAHPAHLLGLVEQCDAVNRSITHTHYGEPAPPERRPIIVHCSAGCGRTGTFCTVDSVIDMLKRQKLARKQERERSHTPMDIDQDEGNKGISSSSQNGIGGGGGGDFFTSQSSHVEAFEGDVEGPWVHRDDQDLIEKTVEEFRHQRLSMVQSLRQYVLCYESVMEWLVEQEEGAERGQHTE
ncbi:hypothetical protein MBLNU230_g3439t1 [Neophaeotheca triangularis]